jgi:hypothetical protein
MAAADAANGEPAALDDTTEKAHGFERKRAVGDDQAAENRENESPA